VSRYIKSLPGPEGIKTGAIKIEDEKKTVGKDTQETTMACYSLAVLSGL